MRNCYKVLGVSELASGPEIKRAWLRLVKQWHPDHNPHSPISEDMLKMYNEAYAVLSDPMRRHAHDEALGIAPPRPSPQTRHRSPHAPPPGAEWDLSEMAGFFGGKPSGRQGLGRRISGILALAVLVMTLVLADDANETGASLFLVGGGLLLVWFGDVIAEHSGPGLSLFHTNVVPTPGWMLRAMGWVSLLLPIPLLL